MDVSFFLICAAGPGSPRGHCVVASKEGVVSLLFSIVLVFEEKIYFFFFGC